MGYTAAAWLILCTIVSVHAVAPTITRTVQQPEWINLGSYTLADGAPLATFVVNDVDDVGGDTYDITVEVTSDPTISASLPNAIPAVIPANLVSYTGTLAEVNQALGGITLIGAGPVAIITIKVTVTDATLASATATGDVWWNVANTPPTVTPPADFGVDNGASSPVVFSIGDESTTASPTWPYVTEITWTAGDVSLVTPPTGCAGACTLSLAAAGPTIANCDPAGCFTKVGNKISLYGPISFQNTQLGLLSYTHAADVLSQQTETITVQTSDLGHFPPPAQTSAAASTTVTVRPTNDAPVLTVLGTATTNEDTPVGIAGSIADPDGLNIAGTLSISVDPIGGQGVQSIDLPGLPLTVTRTDATVPTYRVTLQGPASDINTALATATLTPVTNWVDDITLEWEYTDTNPPGAIGGGPLSHTGTTTISITAINDKPEIVVGGGLSRTFHRDVTDTGYGISLSDVDAGNNDLRLILDVENNKGKFSLTLPPTGITLISSEEPDGSNSAPARTTDVGRLVIEGDLTALNAAVATFSYQTVVAPKDAIEHIVDDLHAEDTLTINLRDLGNTGDSFVDLSADTKVVNLRVTATLWPTCQSFIDGPDANDVCGCYFRTQAGQDAGSVWGILPTSFRLDRFLRTSLATTARRFVQGCCADIRPDLREPDAILNRDVAGGNTLLEKVRLCYNSDSDVNANVPV
eukprot:TRINITY_DN60787_c0_g1_i1.p1 TRINITY_DN60787_c0_g1~~TRINITY_DN60787_c0_g1_i1.p1  ORF type:complete len:695 (-),score=69.92 TRINITY_DN60787_c0_g1_i1:1414-3498(-)